MTEEEHPRKCDNWLVDYLQWTLPRSAAKESYIFWTGLFTLSCTLKRHVRVSKEWLGSWEVFPYMYLMFLGPAGNLKTTTANYNIELLTEVQGLTPAPDQVTVPKLLSSLAEAPECSMYINAGEFSEFIVKSGLDMYSFLTKAFDGVKKMSAGTHMRGIELADKPCINFLAATTLEWFADNIPQSILDGGFGRRCLLIYEEGPRRFKLFYKDVNVKKIYEDHHPNLIHDLNFITNNIFGDFTFTDEAMNKFEQWYQDTNKSKNGKSMKLRGYYETKPAYIMKIAMLLKLSDRDIIHKDQLILDWKNIEESIVTLESLEENMSRALGETGRNIYKFDVKTMYQYIKENQPVTLMDVKKQFMNVAEPDKLDSLITGLSSAGLISQEMGDSDIMLRIKREL